jgi:hypothetical protein
MVPKIDTGLSLWVIGAILIVAVVARFIKSSSDPGAIAHAGSVRGDKKSKASKKKTEPKQP